MGTTLKCRDLLGYPVSDKKTRQVAGFFVPGHAPVCVARGVKQVDKRLFGYSHGVMIVNA